MSLLDKLNKSLVRKLVNRSSEDIENQHREILKLAQNRGGAVTIPEIVLHTSLSLEEAEEIMKVFVSKEYAVMRLSNAGAICYEFPGIRAAPTPPKTKPSAKQSSSPSDDARLIRNAPSKKVATPSPLPNDAIFKSTGCKTANIPDWMKNRKKGQ